MFNKILWGAIAIVVIATGIYIGIAGPKEMGTIDQGRVIAFDKEKQTVTFVRDKNEDPKKPDYSSLPPHTYKMPPLKRATGPEPKVGKRMKLDAKKNEIIIFDDKTQNFKVIPYKTIDKKENVDKKDPLVEGKKFPVIDREKKTITIYSSRQKILETINIPDEYFALPDNTWDAGDEVRVYCKPGDEGKPGVMGKSWKFMNISKTDIYRK